MPSRKCLPGDEVYIRAVVLQACSDMFQVRIEDFPSVVITTWAPASEIARAEDIAELLLHRRARLTHT